jgi:hypothetical protein
VDDEEADRLHAELVEAFFHLPCLVTVGSRRTTAAAVTIVSHVELWPWRTIIAGSVAPADGVDRSHRDRRERAEWFTWWSISDDVSTDYRQQGGGSHGNGFCSDFHIRFEPAPPVEATLLVVTTPDGDVIDVQLPARG